MSYRHMIFLYMIFTSFILIANGFTVKMIPIDSPRLKLLPQYTIEQEKYQYLADISISRGYRYQGNSSILTPDSFVTPVNEAPGNYFVTQLQIGRAPGAYSTNVLIDTGSVETWIQCEGCNPCFELKGQNFNYKNSSSFELLRRGDPLCLPRIAYKGVCGFDIRYYSEWSVNGPVGRDDFSFKNPKTNNMDVFAGLAFGCVQQSVGVNWGNNTISGVLGLAPGPRSLINQLAQDIHGRFSYCIPLHSKEIIGSSTMFFGDDAQIGGDVSRQVKMISMDSSYKYHLYLNGISVDGIRLPIMSTLFRKSIDVNITKGFFIDSGTPFSHLERSAYNVLVEAITKYFEGKYGWKSVPILGDGRLCYKDNYPSNDLGFPSIIFHFESIEQNGEVDMVFDHKNMFYKNENADGFCLMVLPSQNPGVSILGAVQQANFKFLFDISNNLLYFVAERCHEN